VVIPEGKIALGKLAQAMIHGAVVIQIEGNFDAGMALVKNVANEAPVTIVNSINPYRLQGQKTAAFEIIEELGSAPDYHCLPVGNAGNITAHWMGYCEYADHGICNNRPVMVGYQAAGAAPFILGKMVDNPETVATAIRIGHPQSWDKAWQVQKESQGWFEKFSDEEILAAQKLLAQKEGVFCEPASAISLAGVLHDIKRGKIPEGSRVVCTLTGHGLKDPDTAIKQSSGRAQVKAELGAVKQAIPEQPGSAELPFSVISCRYRILTPLIRGSAFICCSRLPGRACSLAKNGQFSLFLRLPPLFLRVCRPCCNPVTGTAIAITSGEGVCRFPGQSRGNGRYMAT
jgi:threonine synthase